MINLISSVTENFNKNWDAALSDFTNETNLKGDIIKRPDLFCAVKDEILYLVCEDDTSIIYLMSLKEFNVYVVVKSKTKITREKGVIFYKIEDSALDKELGKNAVRPFSCTEIKRPQDLFIKYLHDRVLGIKV